MLLTALGVGLAAAAEPAWTLDLDADGAFAEHAGDGLAVAWVPGEVLGIDLSEGTVRWRRPQAEASRGDLFQPVPFTPWVLLSTLAPGPDTYEVIDARSGETLWTAPPGEVVLGVWGGAGGLVALLDHAADPGHFSVARLGEEGLAWSAEDALRAAPPIVPARAGRTAAFSARGGQAPIQVDGAVLTAWSPWDGVVRRDATGEVAWRVLLPGAEAVSPLDGVADWRLVDGVAWLPIGSRRIAGVDAATGASAWKPTRTHVSAAHLAIGPGHVVVGGDRGVEAVPRSHGERRWRVRTEGEVVDVAVADAVYALDAEGWLLALDPADGARRWRVATRDSALQEPLGLSLVDDLVVARLARGAVGVERATGAVRWRTGGEGSASLGNDPLGLAQRAEQEARWRHALFREAPPEGHPAALEHVWVAPGRVDGVSQAILHHVDLRTGAEATVPLGSEHPRWLWDPATHTVLVAGRSGHLEAWVVP